MRDPQLAVHTAIYDALSANEYISTNGIKVQTHVPRSSALPYVSFGELTVSDESTKGDSLQTCTIQIHTWTETTTSEPQYRLMSAVSSALHNQSLPVSDPSFRIVTIRRTFSSVLHDPDGKTLHGVQRYRIVVDTDFI